MASGEGGHPRKISTEVQRGSRATGKELLTQIKKFLTEASELHAATAIDSLIWKFETLSASMK